ncbi:MAG: single-stranded DNA-binding protein [Candidatus Omnitrophota bacterium]|nr:single-stranded DNA-binding protein [Candidatus Omnitrophota bacterium]
MASLNKVLLIGNLTKDPELRYTPNGTAVTNLRLAVNRKFKDRTGELKEDTCFITVTAWDKQAEICNQYLQKGRAVFVEGILQSRSWETSDKQKRSTIDVRAERIQFLSGAPKSAEGAAVPPIGGTGGVNPAIGGAKDTNEQDEVISPEDIAWEE